MTMYNEKSKEKKTWRQNVLLDEYPLLISPSLATAIGLNESIILQQLHYWLRKSQKIFEGRRWVYNTYKDWQKQFPFWSVNTIKRTITRLEKEHLVIAGNFNKLKMDRTKWYTINYDILNEINKPLIPIEEDNLSPPSSPKGTSPLTQNELMEEDNLSPPIPETNTETNTETNNNKEKPFVVSKDLKNIKKNKTNYTPYQTQNHGIIELPNFLFKRYDEDTIVKRIKYLDGSNRKKNNLVGYVVDSLTKGYMPPEEAKEREKEKHKARVKALRKKKALELGRELFNKKFPQFDYDNAIYA